MLLYQLFAKAGLCGRLFTGWKDSCSLLKWSEFKLIILLALNTMRRAVTLLMRYAGPLIILSIALRGIATASWGDCIYEQAERITDPLMVCSTISWMVVMFLTCLSVRASLEEKSLAYYGKYLNRLPFFLLLSLIPPYYTLLPIQWLSVFFFLDDSNSFYTFFRSIYNGFKMFIFYLPLMLAITIPALVLYVVVDQLLNLLMPASCPLSIFNSIQLFLFYCIDLLLLSLLAISYLKIKHSQYQLFFRVREKAQ